MPAKHQVAGEGQQGLVGHRQADDAQHQQGENRQVSVLRDPGEDVLLHLHHEAGDLDVAALARDDHQAAFGDVITAGAVGLQVVADEGVFRHLDVLIQDGAANLGAAADVAVVHDHAVLHQGAGMDFYAASQDGIAHHASGEDAAAGDHAVDGLAAPVGVVEGELGRRIGIAAAAQRPLPVVQVEGGADVAQVHIGVVIGVDGPHVAPIRSGIGGFAGDAVGLEVVGEHAPVAGQFGENVFAEIVVAVRVPGIFAQQFQQRTSGEDVVAHRRVDLVGVAGHGRRVGVLLMESHDPVVRVGFDDAEFHGVLPRGGDGGDSDFGALLHVVLDHAGDVHAVDVIAAEDGYNVGIGLLDQVDVLINGVGRALIPGFVLGAHLCRHRDDELILQQASELPALAEVLQQGLAAELGEHIDGVDPRVDEVAQHEVDNPVLASKRDGRFGPFIGKRSQPRSLAAGEDDAQHAYPHRFYALLFQGGRGSGKYKIDLRGAPRSRRTAISQTIFWGRQCGGVQAQDLYCQTRARQYLGDLVRQGNLRHAIGGATPKVPRRFIR